MITLQLLPQDALAMHSLFCEAKKDIMAYGAMPPNRPLTIGSLDFDLEKAYSV